MILASDYAEWQAADLFYNTFYAMEASYHMAMAASPPRVKEAFRVLRQMYSRVAFAFNKDDRKRLSMEFEAIRILLYKSENVEFAWIPAVKAQIVEDHNEAIGRLNDIQQEMYDAMNDKKMLVPFGKSLKKGYGAIGAGGVTYD